MVSAVVLRAGELVAAVLLAGTALLAVMAAGVWWLRRRVRRRLEMLALVRASQARGAAASASSAGPQSLWSAVAGAGLEHAVGEASDVLSAARQIEAAASATLASVSRPVAKELADDIRTEVVALSAGIAGAAGTVRPSGSAGTDGMNTCWSAADPVGACRLLRRSRPLCSQPTGGGSCGRR